MLFSQALQALLVTTCPVTALNVNLLKQIRHSRVEATVKLFTSLRELLKPNLLILQGSLECCLFVCTLRLFFKQRLSEESQVLAALQALADTCAQLSQILTCFAHASSEAAVPVLTVACAQLSQILTCFAHASSEAAVP